MEPASYQTELRNTLRLQITAATYDAHVAGLRLIEAGPERWLLATPSAQSLEWLQSPRLHPIIEAAAQSLAGEPVTVEIELAQNGNGRHEPPPAAPLEPADLPAHLQPDSPDLQAARADLLSVYFGKGTVGYDSLPYEVEVYKSALLGSAYLLWRSLCAEDNRSLKSIAPNFWTPPVRYSLENLSGRGGGRKHARHAGGDALECDKSQTARSNGHPLQQPEDCCGGKNYPMLWFEETKCGLKCKHWFTGLIEILQAVGLMRAEMLPGYKPYIQVWRLPGLLTPYQYSQLPLPMQFMFDHYIEYHAHRYGLSGRLEWERIGVDYLEPLMPGYDMYVVGNDWRRPVRDKFLANARPNTNFQSLMTENLGQE